MIGITNADASIPYDPMRPYLGNGSDGDVVIRNGETYIVEIAEDVESAVLNCKSLLIEEGGTLKTSGRCPGFFVKVQGDCTINGTITMDCAAPLQSENEEELALNPGVTLFGNLIGGNGGAGGNSGYENVSEEWHPSYSGGAGGIGHVFGGGYGGGGAAQTGNGGSSATRPYVGITWPYPGGTTDATGKNGDGAYGSGAAGFHAPAWETSSQGGAAPGGSGGVVYGTLEDKVGTIHPKNGLDGNGYGGGALFVFVGGELIIGSTGVLTACGGNGADGLLGEVWYWYSDETGSRYSYFSGSGGGGGGGIVGVTYRNLATQGGKVLVNGGAAGKPYRTDYYYNGDKAAGLAGSVGATIVEKFENLLPSD